MFCFQTLKWNEYENGKDLRSSSSKNLMSLCPSEKGQHSGENQRKCQKNTDCRGHYLVGLHLVTEMPEDVNWDDEES